MNKPHYYIYSDGSCTGTATGAWASLVVGASGKYRKLLYGVERETTINRCELQPIVAGLVHIRRRLKSKNAPYYGTKVAVISDSECTVRTMSQLNLDEVRSNSDLWYAYAAAAEDFDVAPRWVSRNSHPYMRVADAVCYGLRKGSLQNFEPACVKWMEDLPHLSPELEVIV